MNSLQALVVLLVFTSCAWATASLSNRLGGGFIKERDKSHVRYLQWVRVIAPAQLGFAACILLTQAVVSEDGDSRRVVVAVLSLCFIVGLHGSTSLWGLPVCGTYGLYWCMSGDWKDGTREKIIWVWHGMLLALNELLFRDMGFSGMGLFGIGMTYRYTLMRSLSYCLDMEQQERGKKKLIGSIAILSSTKLQCRMKNLEKETMETGPLAFLEYLSFFPTYHCGPIVLFRDFNKMAVLQEGSMGLSDGIVFLVQDGFILLSIEIASRTFYFPSLVFQSSFQKMNAFEWWFFLTAFLSMAFWESHLPFSLARACSAICRIIAVKDTPPLVWSCTSSMKSFCRRFHTSWHLWLVEYVYKPCSGGFRGAAISLLVSLFLHGARREWWILAGLTGTLLGMETYFNQNHNWCSMNCAIVCALNQTMTLSLALIALPMCKWTSIAHFFLINTTLEAMLMSIF